MNCHSVRGGSSFIADLSSVYRMKKLTPLAFDSYTSLSCGMLDICRCGLPRYSLSQH